ncbi:MAG TPA: hypothetical protein VLC91_12255 [Spongiibacteraceae bacterium]|nr:hypothetical protein [Spongiibacteraceae bacterium]
MIEINTKNTALVSPAPVIDKPSKTLIALAFALFGFALWVTIQFAAQPLLEAYGFRQTQTALTSYWFMKDGFKLAYETPVAGAPWSIPFEFPLYQWLAAEIAGIMGWPLGAVGRVLSFVFLAACLWPAAAITKKLSLNSNVFWLFACLLFSSPLYLFWGRSFLIETMALFFAFAFIPFVIQLQRYPQSLTAASLAALFMTLALLQKVTTGLPVLGVMSLSYLFSQAARRPKIIPSLRAMVAFLFAFVLPFIIAMGWTYYSDQVKSENALGIQLTSAALRGWNFGSLSQRLTLPFWAEVVWQRVVEGNLNGLFGLFLISNAIFFTKDVVARWTIAAAVAVFMLSMLAFTNLHYVHDYYQTSATLFLIGALAIAVAYSRNLQLNSWTVTAIAILLIAGNLYQFHKHYWKSLHATFPVTENRTMAIAEIIRANTPPNSAFVAFGNTWNSEISYYAERKSFTVPEFFNAYERAWTHPEEFLGGAPLGAIVVCPAERGPAMQAVDERLEKDLSALILEAHGCKVLLHKNF